MLGVADSSNFAKQPVTIQFNGESITLDLLEKQDMGVIERHLLNIQPNVIKLATEACASLLADATTKAEGMLSGLHPDADEATRERVAKEADRIIAAAQHMANNLMDRAFAESTKPKKVSAVEILEWIDTPSGFAYCLWISLNKRYPNRFRLDEMMDVFAALNEQGRRDGLQQSMKQTVSPAGASVSRPSEQSPPAAAGN